MKKIIAKNLVSREGQTTTKKEFIQKLTEKSGESQDVCEKVFYELLDMVVEELKSGNRLEFRNYFVLGTKVQNARQAQNPKTLEKVMIPERRVVYFKKGKRLWF